MDKNRWLDPTVQLESTLEPTSNAPTPQLHHHHVPGTRADNRYFAIGGGDARVSLLDTEHWLVERNYDAPTATIRHIAFSPDGELLAVGGDDPCIYIISVHTRATVHKIPVVGMVNSLAWHPSRNCLAWSTKQPSAVVWYLANQE